MAKPPKQMEKLRTIPRAHTLRQGTYHLATDPASAVVIKPLEPRTKQPANFNEADWFLMLLEAVSEKAEAAYYAGLEQGYETGLQQGRGEVQNAAATFRRHLEALQKDLLDYFTQVEHWSVQLSLSIAEKVIGQAAEMQQDLVKQTVRRALQEITDKSRLFVKVNAADYEILKSIRSEIASLSEGLEHFKIEADNSITPGSCRVETPAEILDADFTTQFGELRRAIIQPEAVSK